MSVFVALLRAVNVGGGSRLPMGELADMCADAGFARVRTSITSGNAVFESPLSEAQVKAELEAKLLCHAGRPVGVLVRTAAEFVEILAANPFPHLPPGKTAVLFLDAPPPPDALDQLTGRRDEEVRPGKRELYVHYPSGMGRSKLQIPAARAGTARNMNTVARLAALAAEG